MWNFWNIWKSWLKTKRPPSKSRRPRPARLRLEVEPLEDRLVMSTLTTLTVDNPVSFARGGEPVTSGVPVAESLALYDTSKLAITDSAGRPVIAQFDVLGRWGAGPQDASRPIRWLQVHFAADVPAQSSSIFQLTDEGSGNAVSGITARQDANTIDIATGPARFQIERRSFNLFNSVWLDVNGNGVFETNEQIVMPGAANGSFVLQSGVDYRSGQTEPLSAFIEQSGPLMTKVRVEGFHNNGSANLLRYVTHLTFYAGQSYVSVNHTLIEGRVQGNGNESGLENKVQTALDRGGLRLQIDLSGTPRVTIEGAREAAYTARLGAGDTAEIVQHRLTDIRLPMSYEVKHNGATVEAGERATRAWLDISDGRWGLAVGTQHFWEKNPERLLARGDGTVQVEFPAEPYTIYQAMGLGENAVFYFHGANVGAAQIAPVLEGFAKDPLIAVAPASWMIASGAFGEVLPNPAPAEFGRLDQVLQENYEATMSFIRAGKSYGLMNYLDMPFDHWTADDNPDLTNWGNSYYDAPSAQIRQFARTGDTRWLRNLAFPQIQHFYTTDMHDTDDPTWYQNGISGSHGAAHREVWTGEYHFMESLWTYYYLTGDARALERGLQAARTYAYDPTWAVDANHGFGPGTTTRINSQKFHTMLQGWLASGDQDLKNALDAQMRDFLTHQYTPEGFVYDRYNHESTYVADQGWMVAVLIHDTVYQYYQATGDPVAREFVITVPQRIAQYHRVSSDPASPDYHEFYNEVEVTVTGPGSFRVRPLTERNNSDDYLYLGGKFGLATALARAGQVSGDPALLTQARALFQAALPEWQGTVWSKEAAQLSLRVMQGLALLSPGYTPPATPLPGSQNQPAPTTEGNPAGANQDSGEENQATTVIDSNTNHLPSTDNDIPAGDGNAPFDGNGCFDTIVNCIGSDDLPEGEPETDIIFGTDGNDFLAACHGNDQLYGSGCLDLIVDGLGGDYLLDVEDDDTPTADADPNTAALMNLVEDWEASDGFCSACLYEFCEDADWHDPAALELFNIFAGDVDILF